MSSGPDMVWLGTRCGANVTATDPTPAVDGSVRVGSGGFAQVGDGAAAGYCCSISAGRVGRKTKSPRQFGHTPLSSPSQHSAQNVHSKVQIRASGEPLGNDRPQRSHSARNSMIAIDVILSYGSALH